MAEQSTAAADTVLDAEQRRRLAHIYAVVLLITDPKPNADWAAARDKPSPQVAGTPGRELTAPPSARVAGNG